jgi:hypothetical protein
MDSKELRIGNLLDRGDYICEVKMIEEEGLILEPINHKEERFVERYIKPIPLTEEDWLIKLGFEKIVFKSEKYGFGVEYHLMLTERLRLEIYKDFSFDVIDLKTDNSLNLDFETFKGIHHLQNFVYSLANKELKYNG